MEHRTLFKREWLEDEVRPQASAFYFKNWNEFAMPFHRHDAVEIMYVINGVCQIELMDATEAISVVTLKKGEFVILNANVLHRLIVDRQMPCRMLNIEFNTAAGSSIFPSIRQLAQHEYDLAELLRAGPLYFVLRDTDEVYHTLKTLVLELDSRGKETGTMVDMLFSQLLVQIARIYRQSLFSGSQQHDIYVNKCIQFIHHNYDRDIQVRDIAASVNLHHGYLHRIFRAQLGQTITEYLTGLRMEKAKMLLQQTDIPIVDICDYIGVGSRQYFHALFKKNTGATPVQYRIQMTERQENDSGNYVEIK
ncbi:AraC family transcriptional regulator [Paenibacillus sp. sgz302251]|uniref:AraC family transcriptional regulator n=1 Tax=Paenibacillus sp. sgz302251 TaxID=3414493 RepID=UPI003C7CF779